MSRFGTNPISIRRAASRRAARLGLAGAMITEYPLEHRRYDESEGWLGTARAAI